MCGESGGVRQGGPAVVELEPRSGPSNNAIIYPQILAKSQEIQAYLRRTQRNGPATHHKWRQRLLPDSAPLVQVFYAGGRPVLRKVAAKLGTYAELDRLSRSAEGRQRLRQAIKRNSPAELIQFVMEKRAATVAELPNPEKKDRPIARPKWIYTADEFYAALREPLPEEPAAEIRAASSGPQQTR